MKKLSNILYLTDDAIYLKNKKYSNIIKFKIGKNIIINSKVANIEKFIKTYEKLLSEHNLNNAIFGETIKIIINTSYTSADIALLKNIFENFNYRKIYFEQESKYYKLNNDNAYLNVFDNYTILSYIDDYKKTVSFLIPSYIFSKTEDLMNYIKRHIQEKEIYLIGKGEKFQEIFNQFEDLYSNKTYMFTDNEFYILDNANR